MVNLNNISFKQIDIFIHAYHIPYLHDYLLNFQKDFILQYNEYKKIVDYKELNNLIYPNKEIYNLFKNIAIKYYMLDPNWEVDENIGIYIQNNEFNKSVYHHHTPSSIAATTYINPPLEEEGGEIQFYLHENNQFKILPHKDCIYFFPAWLMHKPLPQISSQERICINWAYDSSKRPIHKLTGDRW